MRLPALHENKSIVFISKIDTSFFDMPFKTMAIMKIILILLLAFSIKVNANGFEHTNPLRNNAPPDKTMSAPPIIKGVIRDENGNPLAGASVAVKGLGRT